MKYLITLFVSLCLFIPGLSYAQSNMQRSYQELDAHHYRCIQGLTEQGFPATALLRYVGKRANGTQPTQQDFEEMQAEAQVVENKLRYLQNMGQQAAMRGDMLTQAEAQSLSYNLSLLHSYYVIYVRKHWQQDFLSR